MNRCSAIAAAILLAACGEEEPEVGIANFGERSALAICERLAGPQPPASEVTHLHRAAPAMMVLVDEQERQVALLDAEGRRLRAFDFEADGPRGVARLTDAAVSGDSLVVVADAGRNRLLAFAFTGEKRWAIDLDFPPQRVVFAGDRLLVVPVGMDARIPGLLHEVMDGRIRSLGVPFADHPDALGRMFVNSVTVQGYADGSAVVAHQFVLPRAWRVDGDGSATRRTIPMPDATVASVGWVPAMPMREEDMEDMAVPVIASAADFTTGGLVYLTRSGGRSSDYTEKAIVGVDSAMRYVASLRLPMNAVSMAYLEEHPDSVIIVDLEQAWYRCPAPRATPGSRAQ